MFSLHDNRPGVLCDGVSRRELMRIGGLNLLGLSLSGLLQAQALARQSDRRAPDALFGRAKNVIFLYLTGGPPQHETFDPKPEAPLEIRGPFKPISTNVPGIQFCELLPRVARNADKLAVIRSFSTDDNTHDTSGYWILTGNKYESGSARQIKPSDWPYFGSVVKKLKPSTRLPAITSAWLPDWWRLNDNVRPAGQTAGFLGGQWDPDRFIGDPSSPDYQVEGLNLQADISPLRLSDRRTLFEQVGQHLDNVERGGAVGDFDKIRQAAFGLLSSGAGREAFNLDREPERVRERYGRNRWGQCVLLARRLIEAGVRVAHVNWPRCPGDEAVDNPLWDTHSQNADRLQDALCPMFDVGFSALIEDLAERGLLEETLVVAIGEFGRSPKINEFGGRDHWGPVFCCVLAGAGISGGQVYGSSDKAGAYPASNRVQPPELTATMFHLLGVQHDAMFRDRNGRPLPVSRGDPLYDLLGTQPATTERTSPGGDIALVPPYDDALLRNVDFEAASVLIPHGTADRVQGWQASPIIEAGQTSRFGVKLLDYPTPLSKKGLRHAAIGFGIDGGTAIGAASIKTASIGTASISTTSIGSVAAGEQAILSQQVRSPWAGRYTFSVQASGAARSAEVYRELFLKHFTCRLIIFGFVDLKRDHRQMRKYASLTFEPSWAPLDRPNYESFQVSARLRSQEDGARELSKGIGVAIVVEKTSPGVLDLAALQAEGAFVRIDEVELAFNPRPRDDKVTV